MIQIPGYEVLEKIGEGGSSEVFLANSLENRRRVAVKLLHAKYCADAAMRRRLEREAEVVGGLKHPNIVRIFSSGSYKDRFYMVLEFLGKGSLAEFEQLDYRQRLKVMIQVCDGVGFIHSRGIVHRDIKPNNIMFGDDRIPRLVDFGISLFSQEHYTRLTHTNMIMGTLSYMSPEQQTSPGAVDHRTDIYSLGAVLYEVFTSKKPVGRFQDPSKIIKGFDSRLEQTILRCLAHRQEDRYEQVGELQQRLLQLWRDGLFAEDGRAGVGPDDFDTRIGYWIQKLRHGTASERLEARRRIGTNAVADDVAELIGICENSGTEVRAALIPVLADMNASQAYAFFVSQLENPALIREASEGLALLGDKRALPALVEVVKRKLPQSYGALVPLAGMAEEKHFRYVLPYLKSKVFADREAAMKAFELGKPKKYVKDLRKLAKSETDRDLRVRMERLAKLLES